MANTRYDNHKRPFVKAKTFSTSIKQLTFRISSALRYFDASLKVSMRYGQSERPFFTVRPSLSFRQLVSKISFAYRHFVIIPPFYPVAENVFPETLIISVQGVHASRQMQTQRRPILPTPPPPPPPPLLLPPILESAFDQLGIRTQ